MRPPNYDWIVLEYKTEVTESPASQSADVAYSYKVVPYGLDYRAGMALFSSLLDRKVSAISIPDDRVPSRIHMWDDGCLIVATYEGSYLLISEEGVLPLATGAVAARFLEFHQFSLAVLDKKLWEAGPTLSALYEDT